MDHDGLTFEEREKYWYTDIREIHTVREMIFGSRDINPDNPAFWVKKTRGGEYIPINYSLLTHDVDALGTHLMESGLLGQKIAVMGANSYEWIVTYLAVIIGGGVILPIDKELSPREIENLMDTAGCRIIFYGDSSEDKIGQLGCADRRIRMEFYGDRTEQSVSMAAHLEAQGGPSASSVATDDWKEMVATGEQLLNSGYDGFTGLETDPEEMSVLLFTSGTTGNPKGVMLSQKAICSIVMDTCRIAHILPTDKTLSVLPIHHTYECTYGMLLVLYRGASTAFCEGLKYITKNLSEAQNSVFIAVPMVIELIYDRIWKTAKKQNRVKTLERALSISKKLRTVGIDVRRKLFKSIYSNLGGELRIIITGAAALSPKIIRFFEDIGIIVLQGYGLTECTPLVSGTPQKAAERYRKAGSVGLAVRSGDIKIIDKDSNGIGRVLFKGDNVMLGYYNMPEENAKAFIDGWFDTGDRGFTDRDGWLYLAGRDKNVIVTRSGENVYPEEIEMILNQLPCVTEAMVYAGKRDGQEIIACQVYPDYEFFRETMGSEMSQDEIQNYIRDAVKDVNEEMASYKRIKQITVRTEDFIRTTTKKIRRQDNIPAEE